MTMRSWIRQLFTRPVTRTLRKAPHRVRLTLETLEDRWCPSTFTVTNTLDNGSFGSLRWAVGQADTTGGADTIDFDSTVFSSAKTITLSGTQLTLGSTTGVTTITGPAAGVTISGGGLSRVFRVSLGGANFSGLTIIGGSADFGGGVSIDGGTATLTNCTISGNSALGGGGLFTFQGTAVLTNCTISGNTAGSGGGLQSYQGTLTLTNCTISGNTATTDIDTGGGGVYTRNGTTTLTNCTISGNSAAGSGGGLDIYGGTGTMTLTNCTISGNSAGSNGGGLYNGGGATTALTNCTISGNSAGGGLVSFGSTTLGNTIIAGNTGGDVSGSVSSQGKNLIGATDGSSGWVGSDLTGTSASPLDPLLKPLGNYGGPTQTMPFAPGSPAENAGAAAVFTTLTAAVPDAAATSITVADTTGMGTGLYVRIDNEVMKVIGVSSSTTLIVGRGQLGTTAAAHATTGVNVTLAADQRGFVRGANVDIGAWENQSQLFTLTPPGSNPTPDAGNAASFALGSFTYSSTNNIFLVDVAWGDSTSTDFAVIQQGSLGTQSHTYQSAGSPNATVTIFDNDYNFASMGFSVTVNPPISFGTTSLPSGTAGNAYSQALSVSGGAGGSYTYTTTGNLDGLSVDSTGTLLGSPTAAGTVLFTVTAHDSGGSGSRTYALVVNDPPGAPIANGDFASIAEDSGATSIPVLANDAAAGISITSITQGSFGGVAITGGGTGLTYQPNANFNGVDSFTYTINGTATATVIVAVTPVNDAPTISAPASATLLANQTLALGGILVSDIDAGSNQLQVTLSATAGTLTLGSIGGLTFTAGDGSGDSSMTFTGTLGSINNTLAGLTYSQPLDSSATDTVSLVVDDLGNSGSGGPKTGNASIAINPNYNTAQLLPDPFKAGTNALVINGTINDDVIIVLKGSTTNSFVVTINGNSPQAVSGVTGRILVYGQDGKDIIAIDSAITKQTWLSGGAGNDTIGGGGGSDWISGGAGNDSIKGGAGVDRLVETGDVDFVLTPGTTTTNGGLTGLGTDVLSLNSIETAQLTGGAGNNSIDTSTFTGKVTLDGGGGDDTLKSGKGNDSLIGGDGNDTIYMSLGTDTVTGGNGSDKLIGLNAIATWSITSNDGGKVGTTTFASVENLTGGTLADTFKFGNGKSVTGAIDGGAGTNTLDYALYTTALQVNLLLGTATTTGGISNISNVTGGTGNDVLVGNATNNVLAGGGGRNVLIGGGGADKLTGGGVDDILIGGTTDHDNNPGNLDAIMIAWAAALPYGLRISNLAPLLNASTVHDDAGAIDSLTGGLGLDWFLTSTGDVVTDKAAAETKTVV